MKTAKLYPEVLREEIYLLFYLIKDNFQANMKYLRENNVDVDCFGFLPVRRNTRNSVEAFFDMFNLINAENYISVLLYICLLYTSRVRYLSGFRFRRRHRRLRCRS